MEKRECHKVTNGWGTFCDQIRISKLENRHEPLVAGWLRATWHWSLNSWKLRRCCPFRL